MNAREYFEQHRERLASQPYYEDGVLDQIAGLIGDRTDLGSEFDADADDFDAEEQVYEQVLTKLLNAQV